MRRTVLMLLCATVLLGGVRPLVARYDCLMSGAKRLSSCCCKPLAGGGEAKGCCEVTYEDDRPDGVAERGAGSTTVTPPLFLDPAPAWEVSIPPLAPSRATSRGAPTPPGGDDRSILLCTLLR